MYMLIPMDFIILGKYVYVDSTGFLNAGKLCICWYQWIFECLYTMYMLIPMDFIILANYVYVYSTGFWMLVNYVCWFNWGLVYL